MNKACLNCGKRIRSKRHTHCKACREMDAVLRCKCGFVGEPDSRPMQNMQNCWTDLYCPRCGEVMKTSDLWK